MSSQGDLPPAGVAPSARELASALGQGDRDRNVAGNTRRVIATSLGVLKSQKAGRKRGLSLALAAILLILLVVGPLAWFAADYFESGTRLNDAATQIAVWACILCPALIAAALVAGWMKKSGNRD